VSSSTTEVMPVGSRNSMLLVAFHQFSAPLQARSSLGWKNSA
jgi:hypothetical protein